MEIHISYANAYLNAFSEKSMFAYFAYMDGFGQNNQKAA